jgi:hypothetical protein
VTSGSLRLLYSLLYSGTSNIFKFGVSYLSLFLLYMFSP